MENETRELKVVTIEELKKLGLGEVVELPGFVADHPFCVRLRKPSMLSLAKKGKIPNELLVEANKLFNGGSRMATTGVDDLSMLPKFCDLLELICEEAFVEPKYSELKSAGIELTDSQLLAVFSYTQNGVEALKSFR